VAAFGGVFAFRLRVLCGGLARRSRRMFLCRGGGGREGQQKRCKQGG
jgi:hypothetical protein